jgi:hypothetical protein
MIAFWGVIQLFTTVFPETGAKSPRQWCSFLTLCNVHMVVTLNLTPLDLIIRSSFAQGTEWRDPNLCKCTTDTVLKESGDHAFFLSTARGSLGPASGPLFCDGRVVRVALGVDVIRNAHPWHIVHDSMRWSRRGRGSGLSCGSCNDRRPAPAAVTITGV